MKPDAGSNVDQFALNAGTDASTDLPLELEDFFQLLADEQTRYILYLLTERGGTVPISELEDRFDDEQAAIRLHHEKLPRLADYRLVDFDHEAGAVTPTRRCDELRTVLESVREFDGDADDFVAQIQR
ncbi:ArsR/SmtB family transcription factor [Natronolimnohabitans innermongolicus]|uniref:DUF7344 domain-containing protein n=1 Tax=Natronolimnohabitans innermongolicus JCM 12255 TaxID=1227499 RepID=L9WWY7_9EURY|nr:helix-turn-helix transcriptional regulator [Natronolimnohabitans innermongolicus]ELY53984.1 hypothetical protein C493_13078 [Natronolimnohabitans innermongolicus JCM 12255]